MRKELKKKKRIKLRNKRLIKRYPWLCPADWYGNPIKKLDYTYTWFGNINRGWAKAFGMMMIHEIDEILKKAHCENDLTIIQIKEKFGSLTIYFSAPHEVYQPVQRVIDKYSHLSENICALCGKPDIFMTFSGWNFPLCKSCWDKHMNDKRTYEEVISDKDTGRMADSYTIRRFSTEGTQDTTYDISDTAERIRKRYEKRCERSARRLQRLG